MQSRKSPPCLKAFLELYSSSRMKASGRDSSTASIAAFSEGRDVVKSGELVSSNKPNGSGAVQPSTAVPVNRPQLSRETLRLEIQKKKLLLGTVKKCCLPDGGVRLVQQLEELEKQLSCLDLAGAGREAGSP
ncbi:unnamed protein product, partial [Ixodes persulcatus]